MGTYGKRLKDLRRKKRITQKELSKILEISSTTISRYETGEILPTEEIIVKTAIYFKTSSDYLLGLSPCWKLQNDFMKEYETLKEKEIKLEKLMHQLTVLKKLTE